MSKKITIRLSDIAEKYLNEVVYSLDDGEGKIYTEEEAINHILEANNEFEELMGQDVLGFISDKKI